METSSILYTVSTICKILTVFVKHKLLIATYTKSLAFKYLIFSFYYQVNIISNYTKSFLSSLISPSQNALYQIHLCVHNCVLKTSIKPIITVFYKHVLMQAQTQATAVVAVAILEARHANIHTLETLSLGAILH